MVALSRIPSLLGGNEANDGSESSHAPIDIEKQKAFTFACKTGDFEVVKRLLDEGEVNVNVSSLPYLSGDGGDSRIVAWCFDVASRSTRSTCLSGAGTTGRVEAVRIVGTSSSCLLSMSGDMTRHRFLYFCHLPQPALPEGHEGREASQVYLHLGAPQKECLCILELFEFGTFKLLL